MRETYHEMAEKRVQEIMPRIRESVAAGVDPVDAINRHAMDIDSYTHALREYGLKPVIPD